MANAGDCSIGLLPGAFRNNCGLRGFPLDKGHFIIGVLITNIVVEKAFIVYYVLQNNTEYINNCNDGNSFGMYNNSTTGICNG